jgi:hypothetical protein
LGSALIIGIGVSAIRCYRCAGHEGDLGGAPSYHLVPCLLGPLGVPAHVLSMRRCYGHQQARPYGHHDACALTDLPALYAKAVRMLKKPDLERDLYARMKAIMSPRQHVQPHWERHD